MTAKHGLWLVYTPGYQARAILRAITRENTFTDQVVAGEIHLRMAEVVLLAIRGRDLQDEAEVWLDENEAEEDESWIWFLGIAQKGKSISTGKVQVRVSRIHHLGNFPIDEVLGRIPARQRVHVPPPRQGARRIPPASWKGLVDALSNLLRRQSAVGSANLFR